MLVAHAVGPESANGLERVDRPLSGIAVDTRLGARGGWIPGGTEAALQIANGLAALTGSQREVGRNSFSSWRSWPLPLAPTSRFATSPWLNTRRVGMLITL